MLEATGLVLTLLDELELQAFVKTSGGRGLHLVVRWIGARTGTPSRPSPRRRPSTWPTPCQALRRQDGRPESPGEDLRRYLRNRHGATTVSAFSLRARPHLGVSVPIARDELATLEASDQWRFDSLLERLEGLKDDPWAGYAEIRQSLTAARRKRLGVA